MLGSPLLTAWHIIFVGDSYERELLNSFGSTFSRFTFRRHNRPQAAGVELTWVRCLFSY